MSTCRASSLHPLVNRQLGLGRDGAFRVQFAQRYGFLLKKSGAPNALQPATCDLRPNRWFSSSPKRWERRIEIAVEGRVSATRQRCQSLLSASFSHHTYLRL
jgi:hypothetical protein